MAETGASCSELVVVLACKVGVCCCCLLFCGHLVSLIFEKQVEKCVLLLIASEGRSNIAVIFISKNGRVICTIGGEAGRTGEGDRRLLRS